MMQITRAYAAALAEKKLKGTITAEEDRMLAAWAAQQPDERMSWKEGVGEQELRDRLLNTIKETAEIRTHKVPIIKIAWIRYAAAVIMIIGAGGLLWNLSGDIKRKTVETSAAITDVAPGKDKAILTLSDGRKIVLDSAGHGQLATEENTSIIKKGGEIIYDAAAVSGDEALTYNTMSTPRGGQYRLTLPDGSRAWLNSTSAITYPVVFTGKERKVTISGEVYFEIAKNKSQPFIVTTGNNYSIQVLGTHFNVNAYADEVNIRTTLLEGSVRVKNGDAKHVVLRPGQQAVSSRSGPGKITVNSGVETDEIVSWQRGIFMFDNSDLSTIARQLSRWYNVDVTTEGNTGKLKLGGGISKNLLLTEVLELLAANKVKYRWDKGKVILTTSS